MESRLYDELRQTKPFESREAEAMIQILRTAAWLTLRMEQYLKQYELTSAQYNVLRILRGAGELGRSCQEIGERMVTLDSDITRLLDRLEKRGWLKRHRDTEDRRVIRVKITAAGRKVLEELDAPQKEWTRKHMGHLSEARLKQLCLTLDEIRAVE